MKFSKHPFAFIVPTLATGIVFADSFSLNQFIFIASLASFIVTSLILTRLKNERRLAASVLLISSFFFLGGILIQNHRTEPVLLPINSIETSTSYMVQVEEINSPDKEWRKAICTVFAKIDSIKTRKHSEKILLFLKSKTVQSGDQLLIHANLNSIRNNNNPGEFDAETFWKNKNIYRIGFITEDDVKMVGQVEPSLMQNFLTGIQQSLSEMLEKHLEGENLGIAKALILGDKDELSSEARNSFSSAGAMHVLAVSGLHVGIVLYLLIFVLSRFPRYISKRFALLTAIFIIWIYAGTTGFSPSVLRASFMFTLLTLGQLSGKKVNSINVLFFSAFVLLVLNPLLIYDIGFQLSYLAMIGIFTLYPPISRWFFIPNKWLRKVWEGTAVGVAAQIFTVPLSLYYFHQFPNYFALTNIGMMVFAGLVLGLGLFLFAVHWWGFISSIVGVLLAFAFSAMLFFVQFVESIPGAVSVGFTMTGTVVLGFYSAGLIVLFFNENNTIRNLSIALLFILFSFTHFTRFQNLSVNEIVVFNSNDLVIAVKHKEKIICLHNVKKEKEERMQKLLADYQKVRPGEVEFVKLINGTTHVEFGGEKLVFSLSLGGILLVLPHSEIFIRTRYDNFISEDVRVVNMPYLEGNVSTENLKTGALIFPL